MHQNSMQRLGVSDSLELASTFRYQTSGFCSSVAWLASEVFWGIQIKKEL